MERKFYDEYRKYLTNIVHLNESTYQITFIILIFILYIVGLPNNLIELLLISIVCIFILNGLYNEKKCRKKIEDWDDEYRNSL